MTDVRFIDKQGRVGREDKLRPDIFTDFLHHPGKTPLHLRMEMDFRLINDKHSSFEIIPIDSKDDHQQRLFSITQTMEIKIISVHIIEREFQESAFVFHDQYLIEIFLDNSG